MHKLSCLSLTNKKVGTFLFVVIILVHVLAATVPIRFWPLTDYPMFRKTAKPYESFSRLTLEMVKDGIVTPWKRGDYGAAGTGDNALQKFLNTPEDTQLDKIVEMVVKKNANLIGAQSVRIVKKTYQLEKIGYTEKKEIVREFRLQP